MLFSVAPFGVANLRSAYNLPPDLVIFICVCELIPQRQIIVPSSEIMRERILRISPLEPPPKSSASRGAPTGTLGVQLPRAHVRN